MSSEARCAASTPAVINHPSPLTIARLASPQVDLCQDHDRLLFDRVRHVGRLGHPASASLTKDILLHHHPVKPSNRCTATAIQSSWCDAPCPIRRNSDIEAAAFSFRQSTSCADKLYRHSPVFFANQPIGFHLLRKPHQFFHEPCSLWSTCPHSSVDSTGDTAARRRATKASLR